MDSRYLPTFKSESHSEMSILLICQWRDFCFLGGIQQLRRQNFANFWPPTPSAGTVFIPWALTKTGIFDPLPHIVHIVDECPPCVNSSIHDRKLAQSLERNKTEKIQGKNGKKHELKTVIKSSGTQIPEPSAPKFLKNWKLCMANSDQRNSSKFVCFLRAISFKNFNRNSYQNSTH